MTISEVDRWRIVSTLLAAVCVLLAVLLWMASERLQETSKRVLSTFDGCPLTLEDVEHS